VDVFVGSHKKPPKKLVLDSDSTDDPVPGNRWAEYAQASNPGKMRRKQETVRPEALFLTTAIGFSSTVTVNLPEG